jgi:AGCS family alanine or glycine:cation symporter
MAVYNAIMAFTNWMWSFPVLIILIGGGIWLTVACDFIQFKHFGYVMKRTIGAVFRSRKEKEKGKVTGFQAVTACLANTIGTGNIIGVGSAIALGGPGAVFWMWVIGFVAMALKYCEATMGVHTRYKDPNGKWKGGAVRYLGQVWKPLGAIWGICVLYAMAIGCGVHTGSVTTAAGALGAPAQVTTIVVCVVVTIIIFGGLHALVNITDRLVPFMAILYVGTGLVVICVNIGSLLPVLASIFTGAFSGAAATGGFAGAALAATIKNGCARGCYSSDAGNGSASIMHAQADVDDPVEQGLWGVFEVFVDTIVICTFTALVILCTGVWTTGDPGSVLAINAFGSTLGSVGNLIASLGLLLFAGSSVLAMTTMIGLVGEEMFGKTFRWMVQFVLLVCCFVGGTIGVDAALPWADVVNMVLIVLNVCGMLFLTKTLHNLTVSYFSKIYKEGNRP